MISSFFFFCYYPSDGIIRKEASATAYMNGISSASEWIIER